MKTFNKKDVFSFLNVDEARYYKGQECYFEGYILIRNGEEVHFGVKD